jgi:hypothetical protein
MGHYPIMRACLALLSLALLAATDEAPSSPPIDLGVTEETGTVLGQIDVTLTGEPEALAQVGPGSFELWVGGRKVERFLADGLCPAADPVASTVGPSTERVEPPRHPATWILYFDQPHLTFAGRARAIRLARESLPHILRPGDRAAILSNAGGLATVHPMTEDLSALLASLDRLEKDRKQFDVYANQEDSRVACFSPNSADVCPEAVPELQTDIITMVNRFVSEERWRMQRDLSRLSMAIGQLSDVQQPKGVLYFADTTRRNPGDHYLSFLSDRMVAQLGWSFGGELAFDRVLRQAAALGIRFYTVEAQALQGSSIRLRHAQGTLQSMAAETGGRAFVNGVSAKRLVSGLAEDRGCLWLLSFDPEGLRRDVALPVRVDVDVPGVKVQARGLTVIRSHSRAVTDRLLAHFATATEGPSPLRAVFVPLAWKNGRYSTLLQVVAPPTSLPTATWDLGASVVATERVVAETSARTGVAAAGVPVALETIVELKPGPFEMVAVAREITTEKVFSSRTEGTWPDPEDALAEIVQPVVLQPGPGAFTRDGQIRKSGSLVHGKDDPLDASRPTALVALVCRSKMVKTPLDVTRVLEGASPVEFPSLALDLKDERCGQVRDMIPAKTLDRGGTGTGSWCGRRAPSSAPARRVSWCPSPERPAARPQRPLVGCRKRRLKREHSSHMRIGVALLSLTFLAADREPPTPPPARSQRLRGDGDGAGSDRRHPPRKARSTGEGPPRQLRALGERPQGRARACGRSLPRHPPAIGQWRGSPGAGDERSVASSGDVDPVLRSTAPHAPRPRPRHPDGTRIAPRHPAAWGPGLHRLERQDPQDRAAHDGRSPGAAGLARPAGEGSHPARDLRLGGRRARGMRDRGKGESICSDRR